MTWHTKWIVLLVSMLTPACLFAATPHVASDSKLVFNMLCTILVIFMALPGLVLFYGGMVQRKNVLSIFAQCMTMAAIVSLVWLLISYDFAFHSMHLVTGPNGIAVFFSMNHIAYHFPTHATVHNMLNMIYQMGFAAIALVIIIGGFAERMRFSASVIFALLWLLLVYCPIAHWIWGWLVG